MLSQSSINSEIVNPIRTFNYISLVSAVYRTIYYSISQTVQSIEITNIVYGVIRTLVMKIVTDTKMVF